MSLTLENSYLLRSRVQCTQKYFSEAQCKVYLKREDELSFAIPGSKWRKYFSLINALKKKKIEEVWVLGSQHSNNVLAAAQLLKQENFTLKFFLLESNNDSRKGNFALTSLLVDKQDIHFVSRDNWPTIEKVLKYDIQSLKNKKIFILPEGAYHSDALEGAMTLGHDIIKNSNDFSFHGNQNSFFGNIFFDAGTGLSAIGAIIALSLYKLNNLQVHVVTLADKKETFLKKLNIFKRLYEIKYKTKIILPETKIYYSITAKSFGSVNASVRKCIQAFAHDEGILADPIYTAKLLLTSKEIMFQQKILGNSLIIFNSSPLVLSYFDI